MPTDLTQIIIGLIALIGGILTTYLTMRGSNKQKEIDIKADFTKILIERVDNLEERVDGLNTRVIATVEGSEKRIEQVRIEMRKLLDLSAMEVATWRDRYYTIMAEYQALKGMYSDLEIKHNQLKALHDQLQEIYKTRKSPNIEDTP